MGFSDLFKKKSGFSDQYTERAAKRIESDAYEKEKLRQAEKIGQARARNEAQTQIKGYSSTKSGKGSTYFGGLAGGFKGASDAILGDVSFAQPVKKKGKNGRKSRDSGYNWGF